MSILAIILIVINLISWKRIKNIDISQIYKNMEESLNGKLNELNTSLKDETAARKEH